VLQIISESLLNLRWGECAQAHERVASEHSLRRQELANLMKVARGDTGSS
jgi:hypothetical protein